MRRFGARPDRIDHASRYADRSYAAPETTAPETASLGAPPYAAATADGRQYHAPYAPTAMAPAKLPLMRPKRGRWLTGVCKGVSLHLGVSVVWVRLAFLAAACLWGTGVVAYLFLWIFTPVGDPVEAARRQTRDATTEAPLSRGNAAFPTGPAHAPDDADTADEDNARSPDAGSQETVVDALRRAPKPALVASVGMVLLMLAVVMSYAHHQELILPLLFGISGLLVAWARYDAREGQMPTMVGGIALIFLAYAAYVINVMYADWGSDPLSLIAAGLAMLIGVGLAIVPWANAMIRSLAAERAMKEREEERADMTAHLHDGVLQTLALIQLHAKEPDTVFTLARGQERELREWLYQTRSTSDRSVNAGLKQIAAAIEDEHGKPIDVVTVGDARPSAQTDALLDATRQALVNAVTHGGEPVSVYCEAGETQVEVFVRDHGDGFDMDAVPADRLGIRESIIGRVRRRGGTVEVVSRPDWGTEVRMRIPITGDTPHTAAAPNTNAGQRQSDPAA
ncbi:histidine kinase [Bifidobacterium lemurum]|uniref:Histidine kinase n=2 Tax=Bifidobacterium lemurum TaxID=1603886 RepID=A0A261FW45_9BIFI|nr:histidine kinase [Bifidobacterium lemurum]